MASVDDGFPREHRRKHNKLFHDNVHRNVYIDSVSLGAHCMSGVGEWRVYLCTVSEPRGAGQAAVICSSDFLLRSEFERPCIQEILYFLVRKLFRCPVEWTSVAVGGFVFLLL